MNGDPIGDAVWPKLRDGLAAKGFDVLVDREILRPGDEWRREVFSWIGLCHVAVILISRKALDAPNKYWVARETICLLYRRSFGPPLRIIPVLLDNLGFSDLEESERFRGLQLKEIEAIRSCDPDAILAGVLHGIADLHHPAEPGHARLAGQIRAELDAIRPARIEAAIELCDTQLGRWSEANDPPRRLALSLLAIDVADIPKVLGYLVEKERDDARSGGGPQGRGDPQSVRNINSIGRVAKLLLSNWVEMEAAQGIVEEAIKKVDDPGRRALVLNSPDERIARLYIMRAFPDIKPKWTLLSLTSVFGEYDDAKDVKELLVNEINFAIDRTIWVEAVRERDERRRDRMEHEDRVNLLIDRVNRQLPTFVTTEIPTHAPALEAIFRATGEECRFATFVLRGPLDVPAAASSATGGIFRILRPMLSPDLCKEFSVRRNDFYDEVHAFEEEVRDG